MTENTNGEPSPQSVPSQTEQPPDAARPPRSERRRSASSVRWIWTAIIVVGLLAVAAFGVFAYQSFSARMAAANDIDAAVKLIGDADTIVVQIDEVVRAEVTPELAARAKGASSRVPEAKSMLEDAVSKLKDARELSTTDDQERVDAFTAAAQARLDMLEQAPAVLDYNAKASAALDPAKTAWAKVVAADRLSDRAVASYNKLTKPGVQQSSKLNRQAAAELALAKEGFTEAESSFSEAPFELYLAYVEARIRLNKLSQQSDAAWLKNDIKKANQIIAAYNVEDKKAVEQAKALPASTDRAIADAYENAAKQATDAYYEARDAATKADEELRGL